MPFGSGRGSVEKAPLFFDLCCAASGHVEGIKPSTTFQYESRAPLLTGVAVRGRPTDGGQPLLPVRQFQDRQADQRRSRIRYELIKPGRREGAFATTLPPVFDYARILARTKASGLKRSRRRRAGYL